MDTTESVKAYFEKTASKFDAFYTTRRGKIFHAINKLLRSDIYDRFELTFQECRDIEGCSVLDVGCGSGRYAIEFARRGARRVVGIDFAQSMIDLAVCLSRDAGFESKCTFICDDFLRVDFRGRFDYSLAMGFFDYVEQPGPFLHKMKLVTTRKILASFPKDTFPRSTQRKIRYKLKGCPVYFYKREDVERLLSSAGMTSFKIVELQGDYFVAISMVEGRERR